MITRKVVLTALPLLFLLTTAMPAWADAPRPQSKPDIHYTIVPVQIPPAKDYRQTHIERTPHTGYASNRDISLEEVAQQFTIGREGDLTLSCAELIKEAQKMKEIIHLSDREIAQSELHETGIGVAGALGSFLVGSLTGGIGLAAAGYLAKEIPEKHAELTSQIRDTATQRGSLMRGIFQARQCDQLWPDQLHSQTKATIQAQNKSKSTQPVSPRSTPKNPAINTHPSPNATAPSKGVQQATYSTLNKALYNN